LFVVVIVVVYSAGFANLCGHAAHAGPSPVQVLRGPGGGDEAAKETFHFLSRESSVLVSSSE
jgi:hypothetical protein